MSDVTAEPPAPDEQKSELLPSNENPWYLLATLYGEPPKGVDPWHFYEERHAKNRLAWNRYMATIAKPEVLEAARALKNADGSPRIAPRDLQPYNAGELEDIKQQFRTRGGDELLEGPIDFRATAFTRAVIFRGFWFAENVSFNQATFSGDVWFDRATFSGMASFFSAIFSGGASFFSATFSGVAGFYSTTFSGVAGFYSTTFSGVAGFDRATFSGVAGFDSATFSEFAGFDSATFSGDADFENTRLQSSTSFADAKFLFSPPKFHGASLHEGTQWHGVIWPRAPEDRDEAQQHVYNYERLKQEMERLKKHEDELGFFALEMRAKRVVVGKWSAGGLLNAAYDGLSGYGRSIARPFWLLGLSMLLGVVIENTPKTTGALPSITEAYGLSLANSFAILPFVKDAVSRTELSALMNVVGVLRAASVR